MPNLIYGQTEKLLPWAQEKIGVTFRPDAQAIGLERDGEIVAVTVFDTFSNTDLSMHVASDGTGHWLTRAFLVSSFAFPFIQLGKLRVTGLVPANNEAALRFDEHLGFVREGYHPLAGPNGEDLISLGMTRAACRFIPKEARNA